MTNPRLTKDQRENLFLPLFDRVQLDLVRAANGDERVLWALRRKLTKELGYLERSTPTERKKLKKRMLELQKGCCALCGKQLGLKNSELDRLEAYHGYVDTNVRVVHHECHIEDQCKKEYS